MQAQEDLHDVIPLIILMHLNTGHNYLNCEQLAYTVYRHKEKQQAQINTNPKRGRPPELTTCVQISAIKKNRTQKTSNYKMKTTEYN